MTDGDTNRRQTMSKKPNKFYLDYRFIVTAKDETEAIKKLEDFLPESTPEIWFTPTAAIAHGRKR